MEDKDFAVFLIRSVARTSTFTVGTDSPAKALEKAKELADVWRNVTVVDVRGNSYSPELLGKLAALEAEGIRVCAVAQDEDVRPRPDKVEAQMAVIARMKDDDPDLADAVRVLDDLRGG